MHGLSSRKSSGFTIVELLVVIVVIAILAAITIVTYTGISSKATIASLQSDLSSAKKRLALFNADYGAYPETNNCGTAESKTNICLKPSGSNSFIYIPLNINNLNVTSPNGGESWQKFSTHNVTFTTSSAVQSAGAFNLTSTNSSTTYVATATEGVFGYFRAWAWSLTAPGFWYEITPSSGVAATGATSYTLPWTIAVPVASDWYMRVYYYNTGGTIVAQDASNVAFTILP